MKDSEDKILQKYLSGSDKVSASYRSLSDEKPSAELDQSILQAAREELGDSVKQKKVIPYQAYSIAASICVSVLVVSLFLYSGAELTRTDLDAIAIPQLNTIEVEMLSADEAQSFMQENANASQARAESAPLNISAERVAASASAPRVIEEVVLTEERREAEQQGATLAADLADDTSDAGVVENFNGIRTESAAQLQLAPDYRANPDSWLQEIQRLQAIEPAQSAEEIRLFSLEFPDIDIETALNELNEAIQNN